ncbi:hypothetical protein [Niveibacterium terrae]
MLEHATAPGADAIVGLRSEASTVEPRCGAIEVLCYGRLS